MRRAQAAKAQSRPPKGAATKAPRSCQQLRQGIELNKNKLITAFSRNNWKFVIALIVFREYRVSSLQLGRKRWDVLTVTRCR
jgi:hypothetical protein